MRITNKNELRNRTEKEYESESFKDGKFTKEELSQYGLTDDEIATILEYQALLPVLQAENDDSTINARDLHKQLNSGQKFTDWIKNRIDGYQLIENVDYFTTSHFYETVKNKIPTKETVDYILTLDCAKQLAMVERTEIGVLVRRYFIIIEKAFKNRFSWNKNRKNTLINCKELRGALIIKREKLLNGVPEWMTNGNLYSVEFSLLNSVILGMSATQYRKENNIPSNDQIRNYFTEDQLDDIERLERYDAQLIISQEIYSYEERKCILQKEYNRVKYRKTKWV
jgi:phage anti-repressor protein